jgi:hypothetical protein
MTPNEFIAQWIKGFQYTLIKDFSDAIKRTDLENTGDLLRSLYAKVNAQPQRSIFFMTVFFNTYGRYQDMRRQYDGNAGGDDMVEELFQWAQREGVEKFMKGKYNELYDGESLSRVLNSIAWGIIRKYNQQSPKRRRWYNKTKERSLNKGYRELVQGYSEAMLKQAQRTIEQPI